MITTGHVALSGKLRGFAGGMADSDTVWGYDRVRGGQLYSTLMRWGMWQRRGGWGGEEGGSGKEGGEARRADGRTSVY